MNSTARRPRAAARASEPGRRVRPAPAGGSAPAPIQRPPRRRLVRVVDRRRGGRSGSPPVGSACRGRTSARSASSLCLTTSLITGSGATFMTGTIGSRGREPITRSGALWTTPRHDTTGYPQDGCRGPRAGGLRWSAVHGRRPRRRRPPPARRRRALNRSPMATQIDLATTPKKHGGCGCGCGTSDATPELVVATLPKIIRHGAIIGGLTSMKPGPAARPRRQPRPAAPAHPAEPGGPGGLRPDLPRARPGDLPAAVHPALSRPVPLAPTGTLEQ